MEKFKISEVCNISNGFAFKSEKYVNENGARVIRITNVQKGKIVDNDPKLYPFSELDKLEAYKIFEGDILMSLTGNVGRVGRFPKELLPAYINQRVCRVMPKNEKLDTNFLFHFLNSDVFENEAIKNSAGAAQLNLSTKWLGDFEIPLPKLATQQRIAAILDQADAIIQNNRAIVQKYDALTQSLFLDMFGDPVKNEKGWEKVKGSLIYQVKGRVGWKGYKKTDLRESGAYVIGATHIDKFGYINLTNPVYISDEKFLESPEIIIEKNDLIFVQRGNTIGKIGLVRDVLERATINPVVVILRPKVSPYFLLYLLLNKSILNKIIEINSGSAQPMITQNSMNEYQFINPPIELQNQFAERVAVIEAQKQKAQLELAKSEELFNSLLQRAFKGGVELMGK